MTATQTKLAAFIADHGFTPIPQIDGDKVAFFIPTHSAEHGAGEPIFAEVSTFAEARDALGY